MERNGSVWCVCVLAACGFDSSFRLFVRLEFRTIASVSLILTVVETSSSGGIVVNETFRWICKRAVCDWRTTSCMRTVLRHLPIANLNGFFYSCSAWNSFFIVLCVCSLTNVIRWKKVYWLRQWPEMVFEIWIFLFLCFFGPVFCTHESNESDALMRQLEWIDCVLRNFANFCGKNSVWMQYTDADWQSIWWIIRNWFRYHIRSILGRGRERWF